MPWLEKRNKERTYLKRLSEVKCYIVEKKEGREREREKKKKKKKERERCVGERRRRKRKRQREMCVGVVNHVD